MTAQGIITGLIVGACALYMARRWYRMISGKSGGCHCGQCPSKNAGRDVRP